MTTKKDSIAFQKWEVFFQKKTSETNFFHCPAPLGASGMRCCKIEIYITFLSGKSFKDEP